MTGVRRRFVVQAGLAAAICGCASARAQGVQAAATRYKCPPCGCAMDGVEFNAPGSCPACGMALEPVREHPFEPSSLNEGAGAFVTRGGPGAEQKRITIHYYKPRTFSTRSRVLLVIPGAGRNGDAYRDAWIETAERESLLIASPSYPESEYDFAAYHMGGVVIDLEIRNLPRAPNGEPAAVAHVRDEDISFTLNPRREDWLFHDFDRIFGLIAAATGSAQRTYDMFGHSAGGQILHRLALFHPRSAADRIVAANSGFYTLPDLEQPQPTGLKDTGVTSASLAQSFGRRLTLLLGENDNGDEAGGIQIHTPTIDRQGVSRLSRGRYFFAAGQARAAAMGAEFNWSLETVPNVGHDFRAMSQAAARLLYG